VRRTVMLSAMIYGLTTLLCGGGIAFVLQLGATLVPAPQAIASIASTAASTATTTPSAVAGHPLATLLLQIIVVVGAAKAMGFVFRRLRQPAVIGEMLAGIALGPSLLGQLLPQLQSALFPTSSLAILQMLSQIGVVLFMFFVGMELDLSMLRRRARSAVLVSHVSMLLPFFLGTALSLFLFEQYAGDHSTFTPFALFMGAAMSVTAFPVLSRIISERNLNGTELGSTAIACAAVDDVSAWCLLAVVVAIARANGLGDAVITIACSIGFVLVMLLLVRPYLVRLLQKNFSNERAVVVLAILLVFASALLTELIGIHALFGAFLAGAIMPSQAQVSRLLHERIETFAGAFLLPLFFAFTGLRTQIGLLDDAGSWLLCAAIIAVAIAGKFGGTLLAARSSGYGWHASASLGALMNTRGLIELIVLNIGYDLGILSPQVFTMMVIMALVTTIMTGPLLDLFDALQRRAQLRSAVRLPR